MTDQEEKQHTRVASEHRQVWGDWFSLQTGELLTEYTPTKELNTILRDRIDIDVY